MSYAADMPHDFVAPSRIVVGWGRRTEAGALARSLGRRAFIVCGSRTLESTGEIGALLDALRMVEVEPVRLATISHEPLVNDVDAAVYRLREHHAGAGDLLIAIGGGSAIDLAKAAAALAVNHQSDTVLDYLEGVGRGLKIVNTPLPLLAIPTTAGTGTEATKNAVISSLDPPFKKSLRSDMMVPRIVLIDPQLATCLPTRVTAWSGMDAITQLIESFVSRRSNPATRSIAWLGLHGAVDALTEALSNGGSRPARQKMAQAALYSGIALANSGLGMAHGVAAALGIHANVPHGLACAVMLLPSLRFNLQNVDVRESFANAAMAVLKQSAIADGKNNAASISDALARLEELVDELKIPRRLSELGVTGDQIPLLVRDSRGNSMSGNPRDVSDDELTILLEEML